MRDLLIMCTVGAEEPERVNQAFTVSAADAAAFTELALAEGAQALVY